jgi:hypothetical protein
MSDAPDDLMPPLSPPPVSGDTPQPQNVQQDAQPEAQPDV